jgi:hypothetical protein
VCSPVLGGIRDTPCGFKWVVWFDDDATRVDAQRDSAKVFCDLVRIRRLHGNG